MAAELIEAGVNLQAIYRRLFEDVPLRPSCAARAGALGRSAPSTAGELSITVLGAEDFRGAEAQESYSEGIIDYLRAVKGTRVAALVRDLPRPRSPRSAQVSLRATATRSTSRRSRARRVVEVTAARPGSRSRSARRELIAFLRREVAAQLDPSLAPAARRARARAYLGQPLRLPIERWCP